METEGFQILHAIPGRIRVKIPKVKDNVSLANELQHRLSNLGVVEWCKVNPLTGSVVAHYDPELLASLDTLEFTDPRVLESMHELLALAALLELSPENVDTQALEDWVQAHTNGTHPSASTTVGGAVETFFSTLNTKVSQASSGWGDLKTLLPLLLVGLGARSLLLSQQMVFPTWYDYVWFAFGTYVALHPQTVAGQ
jgi:hypothetical protein